MGPTHGPRAACCKWKCDEREHAGRGHRRREDGDGTVALHGSRADGSPAAVGRHNVECRVRVSFMLQLGQAHNVPHRHQHVQCITRSSSCPLSIGHGHRHTRRGGVQSQHTRAPTAASVAAAAPAMTTATWAVSGRGSIQLPAPPLRTNIQRIHEVDDESCGTSSSGLQ